MAFHPLRRLGNALAKFWQNVQPPEPPQPLTPTLNPPRRTPVPGLPIADTDRAENKEYTDDEVADHISDMVGNFPEYKSRTVRRNVAKMDAMDRWLVMHMDSERFRRLASTNPLFWYH